MRVLRNVLFAFALLAFWGCNDEEDKNSIVGMWESQKIEYTINTAEFPFPYERSDESFRITVHFQDDGNVMVRSDSETTNGTYEVRDNTLTTTADLNTDIPLSEQSFTIRELSETKLTLEGRQEGDVTIPGYGTVQGTADVIVYFTRIQ